MQLRAEEISQIIKKQIQGYEKAALTMETGTVLSVGDGIARVYGLESAMAGELVEFPGGVMGLVLNLESDNVGVALFGETTGIKEGSTVKRTGRIMEVPVGEAATGRVVNALGQPIDGKGPIETPHKRRVEEGRAHDGVGLSDIVDPREGLVAFLRNPALGPLDGRVRMADFDQAIGAVFAEKIVPHRHRHEQRMG